MIKLNDNDVQHHINTIVSHSNDKINAEIIVDMFGMQTSETTINKWN